MNSDKFVTVLTKDEGKRKIFQYWCNLGHNLKSYWSLLGIDF